MTKKTMTYIKDVSLITCVVQVGRADDVIKAAQSMGAVGSLVYHARGIGPRERLGLLGIAVEAEKEVINILVASDYQDVLFEAVERHPDFADAWNNLANALDSQGEDAAAREAAQRAIALGGPRLAVYRETLQRVTR